MYHTLVHAPEVGKAPIPASVFDNDLDLLHVAVPVHRSDDTLVLAPFHTFHTSMIQLGKLVIPEVEKYLQFPPLSPKEVTHPSFRRESLHDSSSQIIKSPWQPMLRNHGWSFQ